MVTVLDRERNRSKAAASQGTGGPGGGSVDETQKRLIAVETTQAETKIILQAVATKTEVHTGFEKVNVALEKIIGRLVAIETVMPHMATKAELNRVEGVLATAIANLHASMIKWVVGTVLSGMALAVGIAKLLG